MSLPVAIPVGSTGRSARMATVTVPLVLAISACAGAMKREGCGDLASPSEARSQVAAFIEANHLPGKIEDHDDEKLEFHEVVVVVDSEKELEQWIAPTKPYQIRILQGIHEHGAAPGIVDHIRYVVARADDAEGIIGGAPPGSVAPIAKGWSLWIRHYPDGRKILKKPPADKDLFPGRINSFTLPMRPGPRPVTGSTIPHQQLTQLSPPEVRQALVDWMASALPHIRPGKSLVSDHATWAVHLDGIPVAKTARILVPLPGASEFAHVHLDGSLHLALAAEDRWELMIKGWGALHPAAAYGVNAIMLYAPRNLEEVEIAKKVVWASYQHSIGKIR